MLFIVIALTYSFYILFTNFIYLSFRLLVEDLKALAPFKQTQGVKRNHCECV